MSEGKVKLASLAPDPDVVGFAGLVSYFVELHPEWAGDVDIPVLKADGQVESCMSSQSIVAFSKWFAFTYPHLVTEQGLEFQQRLEQQIVEDGQDFAPRRPVGEE